jgi:hypothetical protein
LRRCALDRIGPGLLAFRGCIQELGHRDEVVSIGRRIVVAPHPGHEKRQERHHAHMQQEGRPRVEEVGGLERSERADGDAPASVHDAHLKDERAAAQLHT